MEQDLVVVALPSVQRFIAEARTTADVAAASAIYSALAGEVVSVFAGTAGRELVMPSLAPDRAVSGNVAESGMPNRVVALFPPGDGVAAARKAGEAVHAAWRTFVLQTFGEPADTPGFPVVQWICVPFHPDGYAAQWREAQQLLAARKRVRDFEAVEWRENALCSLSPQWPAHKPPGGLKPHETAALSTTGWVKRRWHKVNKLGGFPSTSSIASAPFRRAVLEHMDDEEVRRAVTEIARRARNVIRVTQDGDVRETQIAGLRADDTYPADWFASTGGPWVYAERWQADSLARESKTDPLSISADVEAGRKAAGCLRDLMKERYREPAPAAYLAVVVQDVDSMGKFLGGLASSANGSTIDPAAIAHRYISGLLREIAGKQRAMVESPEILGVPVYVGGDDLLTFTPARTALQAARKLQGALSRELPTASTAVFYFHYRTGLQGVMDRARRLLDQGKERIDSKNALAVGYVRRSGVEDASIQPWPARQGQSAADLFGVFEADTAHRLSPRLLADLERDKQELAALSAHNRELFRAELTRLVARHTAKANGDSPDITVRASAARAADALDWLGSREQAGTPRPDEVLRLENAAKIGVFLRQEVR